MTFATENFQEDLFKCLKSCPTLFRSILGKDKPWWRRGVVVITIAQLHSTKPEVRSCSQRVRDWRW